MQSDDQRMKALRIARAIAEEGIPDDEGVIARIVYRQLTGATIDDWAIDAVLDEAEKNARARGEWSDAVVLGGALDIQSPDPLERSLVIPAGSCLATEEAPGRAIPIDGRTPPL